MASPQIRITLHGYNLYCTFTTDSIDPFVRQPSPPITPPPALIFPVHIHKVIHTGVPSPPTAALLNKVNTLGRAAG